MIIATILLILCFIAISRNSFIAVKDNHQFTDIVKFITALLVVNGHLFAFGGASPEWTQEMNIGPLCVSLFLFFSGYGLMCSYEKKGDSYLNGFVVHRLGKLILPLLTAYSVTLPVYAWLKEPIDWCDVIATCYWGGSYLRYSWYVTEILILYVLFYGIMRLKTSIKTKVIGLTLAVLAFMGTMILTHQPIWYIESVPAFLVGIWLQRYERELDTILKKRSQALKYLSVIGGCMLLTITFKWSFVAEHVEILSAYRYQYVSYYAMNLVFIFLSIFVIKGLTPPHYTNSYISACYYEIYLVQNLAMMISKELTVSFAQHWLCTMLLVMAGGAILHKANTMLMSRLGI